MKVYTPGQKLCDVQYGTGVVLAADPEYTTIRFRSFGIKKYVTAMLQMEAIAAPKLPTTAAEPFATAVAEQRAKKRSQKSAKPARSVRPAKRFTAKAKPSRGARKRQR